MGQGSCGGGAGSRWRGRGSRACLRGVAWRGEASQGVAELHYVGSLGLSGDMDAPSSKVHLLHGHATWLAVHGCSMVACQVGASRGIWL
jgi:hypothetical protein